METILARWKRFHVIGIYPHFDVRLVTPISPEWTGYRPVLELPPPSTENIEEISARQRAVRPCNLPESVRKRKSTKRNGGLPNIVISSKKKKELQVINFLNRTRHSCTLHQNPPKPPHRASSNPLQLHSGKPYNSENECTATSSTKYQYIYPMTQAYPGTTTPSNSDLLASSWPKWKLIPQ